MNETTSTTFVFEYQHYKVGVILWRVCSPILLVVGTLGNILSIVVLTRKSMRHLTISFYLTALSCNDLIALYVGLLRQWIKFTWTVDIRNVNPFICKTNRWMLHATIDFSSWILVAVTLERVIAVCFPIGTKYRCTKHIGKIYLIVMGIFLLMVNSHYLFMVGNRVMNSNTNAISPCDYLSPAYEFYDTRIFPWIDLCIFCLFPFAFIITGNAAIIYKVLSSNKHHKEKPRLFGILQRSQVTERSKKTKSMTLMLLTANIVFLVCTLPICIYRIDQIDWFSFANVGHRRKAKKELIHAIATIIMFTNNSVNFILYSLSGSSFRDTLRSMFGLTGSVAFEISYSTDTHKNSTTSFSS